MRGPALIVIWLVSATAGAALLPRIGRSAAALAVWAEAEPRAVSARYAARLELAGSYPGRTTLPIDPLLRDPEPCTEQGDGLRARQPGRRRGHQRPRRNSRSSSSMPSCTQVGRP